MNAVLTPITALKPAEWNPRLIRDERFKKLCDAIADDPEQLWTHSIGARWSNPGTVGDIGEIYDGNMRYRAVCHLKDKGVPCSSPAMEGWSLVPAVIEDISIEIAKKRAIRANSHFGEYTDEINELVFELGEFGVDIGTLGFTDKEIHRIMSHNEFNKIIEDEPPAPPVKATTTMGQMFRLGSHVLLCGDSTDAECMKKLMGDNQADLIVTDPPYNVAYEGKTKEKMTIENDEMSNEQFYEFLLSAFKNAHECTRGGGAFYICHSDQHGHIFRNAVVDAGFIIKQCIIWRKNTMVMGRQDYQWDHEPILYGWKKGTHFFIDDRKQRTVWEFPKPNASRHHPTMKPVELCAKAITNSSRPTNIVLDPFGGSGTTLVACEQTGRRCFMMEIDPRYCDVIIERWEKLTGEKSEEVNPSTSPIEL